MPVEIRKLSSDEAAKVFPKPGAMDLSAYADALRDLQPGDAAEIELGPLSSRALKRRLGQAARQTGYALKWARNGGTGVLRFQVREARGAQMKGRNGRRGRRRSTTEGRTGGVTVLEREPSMQPARLATQPHGETAVLEITGYTYLPSDSDSAAAREAVRTAMEILADMLGLEIVERGPPQKGSFLQAFRLRVKDLASNEEVAERLRKVERAVEIQALERHQAAVDKDQADATARLVESLANVPNAVLQVGSIVVVKRTNATGKAVVVVRTLTTKEMIVLQDPEKAVEQLDAGLHAIGVDTPGTRKTRGIRSPAASGRADSEESHGDS